MCLALWDIIRNNKFYDIFFYLREIYDIWKFSCLGPTIGMCVVKALMLYDFL